MKTPILLATTLALASGAALAADTAPAPAKTPDAGKVLPNLAPVLADSAPFKVQMQGDKRLSSNGDWPFPYSANLWDSDAKGTVELVTFSDKKAIALRNTDGSPALQFYNWQTIKLPAGHRYTIHVLYATEGNGNGALKIEGKNIKSSEATLGVTSGKWKTLDVVLDQSDEGALKMTVQNRVVGVPNSMYLGALDILDQGDLPATPTK